MSWLVGILTLSWTLTGVSIVLSFGRYVIHYKYMQRLGLSDGFHILALLLLLGVSITYQLAAADINTLASADPEEPISDDFIVRYRKETFSAGMIWFACLYAVKFCFLFFYRTLFKVRRAFMIGWWIVLMFTLGCFAGTLASFLVKCGGTIEQLFDDDLCGEALDYQYKQQNLIIASVFNIVTDVAIMVLPLWQINSLQMRKQQKIGFAVLFSLAAVGVILEIVRTCLTLTASDTISYYVGFILGILESQIAVIISTLTAYRLLIGRVTRKRTGSIFRSPPQALSDMNAVRDPRPTQQPSQYTLIDD